MSRTDPQFKLRMPAALRAQIELAAWKAKRSLNAEIVHRLESTFISAEQLDDQRLSETVRSRLGGPTVSVNIDDLIDEARADDKSEPVPAIAPQGLRLPELLRPQSAGQDVRLSPSPARRELRLLCVPHQTKLGESPEVVSLGYLPIHTMHRVPPRAMVKGKWSQPRYAGLYLRETQAIEPTAEVLARCERHRQTNALRAPARTVRTGGVSA